ncbi:MAG: DUF3458 domain-containing protein, partial [Saprospiraceae bacterium]|nr:DUF3458 domain-containing protein [Saprospiraceae bacterium]
EADYHLLNEWLGYFNASKGHSRHDLIDFTYDDKEDMFDAHSYNKGGSVLHMLRNYLGDEVFFKGLQYYLQKNAYTDVEANELRLAMEDVSGEDLNWFFNQWYFSAGHPVINYTYGYNAENHKATITIEQTQLPEDNTPYIFQLPLDVDIFFNGKTQAERKKIVVTKRNQTFEFDAKEKPSLIMIDPQGMLLAEINDNKTDEEYIFQYENCKNFLARYKAIQALKSSKDPKVKDIVKKALSDNSWSIREEIIDFTNPQDDPQMAETLATMAQRDVHSAVRTAAIKKLAETKDAKYAPIAQQLIEKDPTDKVVEASLLSLIKLDKASALSYAEKMEKQNNKALFSAIASIYSSYPSESRLQFFEKNFSKVDGFEALSLFANYRDMLKKLTNIDVMSKLQNLYNLATNTNESPWKRYAATKVINDMRTYFRTQSKNNSNDQKARDLSTERANVLTTFIEDIKVKETNAQIKTLINAF